MKGFKKAWDDICGMDDKDIAEELTRLRNENAELKKRNTHLENLLWEYEND